MPISTGTRLGPYEIVAPIGSGGMGEVWRARDPRLGREVAIKVLPEELSSDRERVRRFEREARAASALNHPNIVTIHEVGQEGGRDFLVMEKIEGRTLRELLLEGALPPRRLLPIACQIADGLARAHEEGIVHRDLKPENVMVTKDGFVKILDFGLAKLEERELPAAPVTQAPTATAGTAAGILLGTVGYMSPEQASGRPLDFRSDQFSFGAILYEMAAGRRAFQKETAAEILAAIIRQEPEVLEAQNPPVPAPLRWIIERCLAKNPDDRYVSTRDLARELAMLRDHLLEAVAFSGISPATPARSWLWPTVAGILLVATAALGFLLWSGAAVTEHLDQNETLTIPRNTKRPINALPHAELVAKLKSLINLRAVRDPASSTGWKIDLAPFPGWAKGPEWKP